MGVKWRGPDLSRMATSLENHEKVYMNDVQGVLDDVADAAVSQMQQIIATTPSAIVPGKADRIDTGTMHDAVDRDKVQRGRNVRSVRFGWVNEKEDYFIDQEEGTGDKTSGGFNNITPMHALRGSFLWARDEVVHELRQRFKKR